MDTRSFDKNDYLEYLNILNSFLEVVVISFLNGKLTYKSAGIEKHFGWEPQDLIGKDFLENVHDEDSPTIQQAILSVSEKPTASFSSEGRYKCKDGSYKWIRLTGINLMHTTSIEGIFVSFQDINDQKNAEFILEEKDTMFMSLFQNSKNIISIYKVETDKHGKPVNFWFEAVNAAFEQLSGFKMIQLVGKSLLDIFPHTEKIWIEAIEHTFLTGVPGKLENYAQSFDKYMEVVVYRSTKNTIALIGNDITNAKLAEEALKESEERGKVFIENIPLPVAMFDTNMCYLAASKRWLLDYKLGDQNLIGMSHYEAFPEISDKWKDDHQRVLKGEVYKNNADKFIRQDGTVQWLRYELRPWYKSNGNIGGLIMFTEDITDRILAEQGLIESEQRLKALHNASFGGITIHDKGLILDCNRGLSEISGYSYEELIGMDGLLLVSEKSRGMVMSNILTGYEKPYEAIGLRKNGEEYPIRLEARTIPYKGKMVRSVEFRDITQIKKVEVEIIRAKEKAEESEFFLMET